MQLHMSAIRESYKLLDQKVIEKTVAMIEAARRVFFFGIGDSLLFAEEARNKFLRITGKVSCITDPHMQSMAAATATKEDLDYHYFLFRCDERQHSCGSGSEKKPGQGLPALPGSENRR